MTFSLLVSREARDRTEDKQIQPTDIFEAACEGEKALYYGTDM
jgi:hypothetical protein